MAESIRSFISFDIEDELILERIAEMQQALNETGANLKTLKPKNIHVTMRFLGNIRPDKVEETYEEMKKIQFTPFDFTIKGIGVFPNFQYLRVIWAGIADGAKKMQDIFDQLEPRLRKLGFPPDRKGFNPHLTIARVRSGRKKDELAKYIKEKANREFGTVTAKCLRLKRSDLTPEGPTYSTLRELCP